MQTALIGIAIYITIPYLAELAKTYYTLYLQNLDSYFRLPSSMIKPLIYAASVAILGYGEFVHIRNTIYSDHTNGRIYGKDHTHYKRSWAELIDYFKDADPYRIDPKTLPKERWEDAEGIILGRVGDRLIRRPSDGVGNLATFGLPGSGKTQSQIIPTAIRFGGSCLVVDIKGDILSKTRNLRTKVKVFSPGSPEKSCCFNPLHGIETMNLSERYDYIEKMASIIIKEESKDPFFYKGARSFFCGIFLHSLHNNINTSFPDIVKSIIEGNGADWVTEIRNGTCAEAQAFTNSMYGTNLKNVSGCYQHLVDAIRIYGIGGLASILRNKGDCISAEDLDQGFDIYLEIPQHQILKFAPVTNLIIENFTTSFMQRPDNSSVKGARPILFLLDEYAQIASPGNLEQTLSGMQTLRSKNVTYFLAMQSVSSLSYKYGDDGFRQIMDACAFISVMSAQDTKSREYFQKMVGTRKVLKISNAENRKDSSRSIQEAREPIYQPEAFGNLEDKVIIMANGKYIEAQKTWVNNNI